MTYRTLRCRHYPAAARRAPARAMLRTVLDGLSTTGPLVRLWLDALEVDPVDLMKHGIKGKKKLAEILDCYSSLLQHSKDSTDQARIRRRAFSRRAALASAGSAAGAVPPSAITPGSPRSAK